jgi:ATP-dependent DNA ligase
LYAKGEGKTSATRSKHLLKYKPLFDEEFEIVDYKSGDKGKEIGAIIFVLKTKDDKTFNAVPNMPYEERYSLYK